MTLNQLSNPMLIAQNPEQAMGLWESLKESIKQNEIAISQSPNQIKKSLDSRLKSPAMQAITNGTPKVSSDGRSHDEISDEELDAIIARGGK